MEYNKIPLHITEAKDPIEYIEESSQAEDQEDDGEILINPVLNRIRTKNLKDDEED